MIIERAWASLIATMVIQSQIENKLKTELSPSHLEVINESHGHSVPRNSETHFKVIVVSDKFEKRSLVERHREIYRVLGDELKGGVHALALHTYTPSEWEQTQTPKSPPCLGGSKT